MTTHNSIIADLSHEIDRLQKVSSMLLSVAIRASEYVEQFDGTGYEEPKLLGDLRYAIDEAHHG